MKRVLINFLTLAGILVLTMLTVLAEPVEIRTPQELAAIEENPAGEYVLGCDIDMSGEAWSCPDFSGVLDGNGHSILNLTVTEPGSSTAVVIDGNLVEYDACFAGLFGQLKEGTVKNLNLINLRVLVETDAPCFAGAVAGYSENCEISSCKIINTMELRAHEQMFGIGGVIGFGTGSVKDCDITTTLICTDTDPDTKDEQFLGGVLGCGYATIEDCKIQLKAYISEYGYVHSGGIAGMVQQYPIGMNHTTRIGDNVLNGTITFFEKNDTPRAYCEAFIGETQRTYGLAWAENELHFTRDQRTEYDRELRPEMCEAPEFTVETVKDGDYTCIQTACTKCGNVERDHYSIG